MIHSFFFEKVLIKFCDINRCVARFTYCLEKGVFVFYGLVKRETQLFNKETVSESCFCGCLMCFEYTELCQNKKMSINFLTYSSIVTLHLIESSGRQL